MIKTYEAIFDEEHNTGVYGISLVENPAMEGLFVALNKDEKIQFKELNKEERKVVGLVLEPNKPIYRNNQGEEYNIVFSEQTIKNLSYNFFKQNFQKNSTIEHESENKIENVTFVESWIVEDVKTDKQQLYGFNYPKGSWLAVLKIDNDEVWNDYVKTGAVKGFSIDGLLSLKEVKMSKNQTNNGTDIWFSGTMLSQGSEVFKLNGEFLEDGNHILLTDIEIEVEQGIVKNLKSINMSKEVLEETQKQTSILTELANAIKTAFTKEVKEVVVSFGSVKTADGQITIEYEGDDFVVGGSAWIMADAETKVPVPVGEHPLEDGRILVVTEEGIVAEIKEAVAEEEAPAPAQEPMSETAKNDAEIAKEIETAIKSILIKYSALEEKVDAVLKENAELKVALSQEPAKKRINAVPTQVDLSKMSSKERLFNKLKEIN